MQQHYTGLIITNVERATRDYSRDGRNETDQRNHQLCAQMGEGKESAYRRRLLSVFHYSVLAMLSLVARLIFSSISNWIFREISMLKSQLSLSVVYTDSLAFRFVFVSLLIFIAIHELQHTHQTLHGLV